MPDKSAAVAPQDRAQRCWPTYVRMGPRRKLVDHLVTARHFMAWCIEHPDQARDRFHEAVPLLAEMVLTEGANGSPKTR